MELITDHILFNALKHHRGYIHNHIRQETTATLPKTLKVLGNSQMDIYYGKLVLPQLFGEALLQVKIHGISDNTTYLHWLQTHHGYFEITLSDTSRWILLPGVNSRQFIHLHPARYSPHSMRVKATTLKTAITCMVYQPGNTIPDLAAVNAARQTIALSPVKDLAQCHHLWKVMQLLTDATPPMPYAQPSASSL